MIFWRLRQIQCWKLISKNHLILAGLRTGFLEFRVIEKHRKKPRKCENHRENQHSIIWEIYSNWNEIFMAFFDFPMTKRWFRSKRSHSPSRTRCYSIRFLQQEMRFLPKSHKSMESRPKTQSLLNIIIRLM